MQLVSRFYKKHPLVMLFTVLVMIPLYLTINAIFGHLEETNTSTKDQLYIDGVSSLISISRDERGVVSISAKDDNDVFFAIGYAHAQDRMWQLELQRRMSQGRLAEVFGKAAVNLDIYVRTLGLYKNAELSKSALGEAALGSLQAYAAGVNRWIREGHSLPFEFTFLGIEAEEWKVTDSLAWIKMFGLTLSGNFQQDLNRLIIHQSLPSAKASVLTHVEANQSTITSEFKTEGSIERLIGLSDFAKTMARDWRVGAKNIGSNAWVVSGRHTKSGNATLANDPHMGLEIPSQWYAVNLKGERIDSSGMSMVGLPIVMLGKNQDIAWGATNMLADTMDLFYEEVNLENTNQYRRGNSWQEFTTREETINVKADFPAFLREALEPLKVRIRETDTGPIISDIIGNMEKPLSLRWLGGSKSDTSYEAFFRLNYARNWQQFQSALSLEIAPAMNLFYIDREQNIGFQAVGRIPVRKSGNGSLPIPGWDQSLGWNGYIPYEQMPNSFNPENGYLLSANNQNVDSNYPYFISQDWAEPERAERIESLIQEKLSTGKKLSLDYQTAMQLDQFDLSVQKLLPYITAITAEEDEVNEMLTHLKGWDGSTDTDSISSTLFFTLIRHLKQELFSDEFTAYWREPDLKRRQQAIVSEIPIDILVQALQQDENIWCDRQDTKTTESCQDIILESFYNTYNELYKLLGSDMDDWRWGQAHETVFRHQPFSNIKGLDILFERRFPAGGSPNSIDMSESYFKPGEGYLGTVGATFRQIISFNDKSDTHLFINSTGQSGNVASEHYDDMIESFASGKILPFNSAQALEDSNGSKNVVESQEGAE